ncbi:MAG TPA: RagB/SusD family nutrient uptake outer membrane protein [Gemmatimonadaceae bacterium]|nr:RagB/SusD family nutrient uptake outer membrane protein [Gemmatimonadaceae bacterium]
MPITPRVARTARRGAVALASALLVVVPGCTDLTENPESAVTPENYYRTSEEVIGGLAAVYAQLRSTLWNYYNLSEVSTDEFVVPTRGSDWYDNGRWLEIHRQTWEPASATGLEDINGAWVESFTGIARANLLLAALENVAVAQKDIVIAEIRTLRAFYYYTLMDMFGNVPIVTDVEIKQRAPNTRAEVFAFIEDELLEARDDLPPSWSASMNGRLTKGAAEAILANMYLNAQVFTGTVTATGLQPGPARWQDAIDAVDRILALGVYSLPTDWKANFRADNHLSPETIMAIKYAPVPGIGFEMVYRGLHYNQTTPTPWNGFSTIAETYYAFDTASVAANGILTSNDQRHDIFLDGPQVNVQTGLPITDREGTPLFYTPTIGDVTQARENEGVRVYKWPEDPNHSGQWHGNDYAYFRLAEMYLIKAEALNELNQTGAAVTLVNTLRARVFEPDRPLTGTFTQASFRDRILRERLNELTAESKRRQDLIRHGKYLLPWSFKEQREAHRILFPIPQTQIDANPMLVQNPGY